MDISDYWESDLFDPPNPFCDDTMDSELPDDEELSDPIHQTNTRTLRGKLTAAAALPAVKNTLNYTCAARV